MNVLKTDRSEVVGEIFVDRLDIQRFIAIADTSAFRQGCRAGKLIYFRLISVRTDDARKRLHIRIVCDAEFDFAAEARRQRSECNKAKSKASCKLGVSHGVLRFLL